MRCKRCNRGTIGVLEAIAGAACPACGTTISIANAISKDREAPEWLQAAVPTVVFSAVVVGLVATADRLLGGADRAA